MERKSVLLLLLLLAAPLLISWVTDPLPGSSGYDITEATVDSGLHDLILSAPRIRRAVYDHIFTFLRRHPV